MASIALVAIGSGFEEIETATIVDVLRRGGVDVRLASIEGDTALVGSRGITFVADCRWEQAIRTVDVLVLPGGMRNAEALAAHKGVRTELRHRRAHSLFTAALCAAPLALDAADVLSDSEFTCYPGLESRLSTPPTSNAPVVDAGWLVTSRGPATAMAFALHVLSRLEGKTRRDEVAHGLLC
jgi:4-methyl-5(b-hydroxyethyl)-thiazole monophosphate biosynthesis